MKKKSKEFNVDEHIEQMVEHRKNIDAAFEKIENALSKNISKVRANELRIGNYVSTPNQPIFRIDLFDYVVNGIGKFGQITSKDTHPLTWYLQDLKPIPLTEDWLKKLGFIDKDYTMELKAKRKKLTVEWYLRNVSTGVRSGWYFNKYRHIKYVHQLQNLYFALTDEELTIVE